MALGLLISNGDYCIELMNGWGSKDIRKGQKLRIKFAQYSAFQGNFLARLPFKVGWSSLFDYRREFSPHIAYFRF